MRDELRWLIEARRKQLLRDLSMLHMVNLGFSGGDKAQEAYNEMLNEYLGLEGIDRKRQEADANWNWLKMRKRG